MVDKCRHTRLLWCVLHTCVHALHTNTGKRKQRKAVVLPKNRSNYERDVGNFEFSSSQQIALHDAGAEVNSPALKRPKSAPQPLMRGAARASSDAAQQTTASIAPPQPAAHTTILQPLAANPVAPGRRVLSLTSGMEQYFMMTTTFCHAVDDGVRVWAEQAIRKLRGAISADGLDQGVTHVVVGSPRRTLKVCT